MKKLVFFLVTLGLLMLPGLQKKPQRSPIAGQLAKSITVTCHGSLGCIRRYYDSPEKMQALLRRLRNLGPLFLPDSTEAVPAESSICVRVRHADGSTKRYYVKNDQYVCLDGQNWRQLAQGRKTGLWPYLSATASDPAPALMPHGGLPRLPCHELYQAALRHAKTSDK